LAFEKLLKEVVKNGEIVIDNQSPQEIHGFLQSRAELLPDEHKRFISPHIYKTGITQKLMETRNNLANQIKNMI
jgi:nicotinate phosphoribosyltransferase